MNIKGPSTYNPVGLWWNSSNETGFISLVKRNSMDPPGGLNLALHCKFLLCRPIYKHLIGHIQGTHFPPLSTKNCSGEHFIADINRLDKSLALTAWWLDTKVDRIIALVNCQAQFPIEKADKIIRVQGILNCRKPFVSKTTQPKESRANWVWSSKKCRSFLHAAIDISWLWPLNIK